jgi:chromosome segregation ATPase
MSERLDRIEAVLESIATSQENTQRQVEATQLQLNALLQRVDSLADVSADLKTSQIVVRHQVESNAAVSADIRLATAALLQAIVRHDARLERLENPGNQS